MKVTMTFKQHRNILEALCRHMAGKLQKIADELKRLPDTPQTDDIKKMASLERRFKGVARALQKQP